MSISTEDRVNFCLMKYFESFPKSFQLSNQLQLFRNQLCQVSSVLFLERVNKGELKMVNIN